MIRYFALVLLLFAALSCEATSGSIKKAGPATPEERCQRSCTRQGACGAADFDFETCTNECKQARLFYQPSFFERLSACRDKDACADQTDAACVEEAMKSCTKLPPYGNFIESFCRLMAQCENAKDQQSCSDVFEEPDGKGAIMLCFSEQAYTQMKACLDTATCDTYMLCTGIEL
jgi:hypothetical protein